MKKIGMKKFFKWFGIGFGIIFIIGLIYIGVFWGKQIATLISLKQVNGNDSNYPFYKMTYRGDYGFDEYLKKGSKDETEYYNFILKKTMNGLDVKIYKEKQKPNCSSFTAKTPNGDRIFARNLDSSVATPLLLKTNPANGYKSMSMVNLCYAGIGSFNGKLPLPLSMNSINALAAPYLPLDGVNEHGLAISMLTAAGGVSFPSQDKITLNDFSLMRMVLDKTSTVDEAVKMIKKYNMRFCFPYASHFMIADKTGASVVIEYVKGDMKTVRSDKPYQIVTNFMLYDNPNGGFGLDRYKRIEAKLEDTKGILTEKEAMKLLSENTIPGDEQWSVVYNLTKKKAFICVGKNYETIYEFAVV